MATVRDILADNPSGISRPGLLAWSRLRIDPAMTEEQLEEAIRSLGDDVVERQGFLYLRGAAGAAAEPAAGWRRADDDAWAGAVERPTPGFEEGAGSSWAPEDEASATPTDWITPSSSVGRTARVLIAIAAVVFGVGTLVMGLLGAAFEDSETFDPGDGGTGTVIHPDRLAVGDCIQSLPDGQFDEIRIVDCSLPHRAEVFHVAGYEGDPAGFPTDSMFERWAEVNCDPAFAAYTGSAWDEQGLLDMGWFTPVEAGWAEGDRGMVCWLTHADGTSASVSYRDAEP